MSDLVVRGGAVLVDGGFVEADVLLRDGRIDTIGRPLPTHDADVVDAAGCFVAPGFIDVQINGGWGHDFTADPASIGSVAARLPTTGVTAFLPTIVTAPVARREAARAALAAHHPAVGAAVPLGLHFEGPLISPEKVGAHDPAWVGAPGADELATWTAGDIRWVTLAPDAPGALAAIAPLADAGVVVAIGHTACSTAEFAAARAAGASAVTHLFNAMGRFDHRAPGPIGAALADDRVVCGLICDGLHVDPTAVTMAWRALGPARTMLVTDAAAALGMPEGSTLRLGDVAVRLAPDGVRTPDGVLAGSALTMDQAVRNLVTFTGCAPAEALTCATRVPADLLRDTTRGRIAPGARADVVVLDRDLGVVHTIIEGRSAWRS